ncbi:BatA domain-containing protein [Halorussus gelatinilyticus]|uniref:BatA domain-containing protein n=1 Tax=Halorussus gelatinilyticus TaxID=2937524 RepID=A0A8U0IIT7_9EURY|nr:BatA domain-containing protein [Halorussus gelatinilyticus]UPW00571.1 BatA domain-containing protein [Halorussus gelatinilyticus]
MRPVEPTSAAVSGFGPLSTLPGLESLSSAFLRPLGLAALAAAIPVLALYLLKPDPERIEFPAVEFLAGDSEERRRHPALRRLRRNAVLAVQLLAILAVAVSLAAPYVPVSESETVSETVLVVDATASMATESGGTTRFDRAISAATDAATAETSVVVAGAETAVVARRAPPAEAKATLSGLSVADAPGDLRGAIDRAAAVAGEEARIVVVSDFASDDWRSAVASARARGYDVSLRQFARGGASNVGVVNYAFADGSASVRVKNFGDAKATRKVSLGDESVSLTLAPGEVASVDLPVPAGGGTLRLSPGDRFPTDDRLSIAAPDEPTMDVLVVTNDPDRSLVTALRVIRGMRVTVKNPPASVSKSYDLVVFGGVEPGRLLNGTVQVARETLAGGGGVVIQAQSNLSAVGYGDLLPVVPNGTVSDPAIRQPNATGLTADVTFPAPKTAVRAELRSGRALLETVNGTPLLASAPRGPGEILYYGYPDGSSFAHNYRYPVFWKRVVYDLTGRRSLSAMNPETGTSLSLGGNATAKTPSGTRTGSVLTFREAGFYAVGGDRYGASLASATESNVSAPRVGGDGSGASAGDTETTTVPQKLTPVVAGVALVFVLLELAVLRYRGDL